jgi:ribonuclease-3
VDTTHQLSSKNLLRKLLFKNLIFAIWPLDKEKRWLSKQIKQITGFYPSSLFCYEQALRHHSASKTIHQNGSRDSNERLEFLGDAMLNSVIAEYLFKKFPYQDEGFLTQMRSKIVSRESLNELALKIQLNKLVVYDKRTMQNLTIRNSIFGNALEAFLGAIYLDGGFYTCRTFILEQLIKYHVDVDKLQKTETNFKGRLIEQGQKEAVTVEFLTEENNQGKQKIFVVSAVYNNQVIGVAENLNKKKAEQLAAQKAIEKLAQNQANQTKFTDQDPQIEDK